MRFARTLAAGGVMVGLTAGALVAGNQSAPRQTELRAGGTSGPIADVDEHRGTPGAVGEPTESTTTVGVEPTDDATSSTDTPTAAVQPAGPPPPSPSPTIPGVGEDETIVGVAGALSLPAADPGTPIGDVATAGHAPQGLDFASFPGSSGAPAATVYDGPSGYGIAPGCNTSCITSGLAYPRGFGAELVVETTVPATVFVSVIADTDGDGEYDFGAHATSSGVETDFDWVLDHLDPSQEYFVVVAATDANDRTDHAYGSFTTLSTRTAYVSLDGIDFHAPPAHAEVTLLWSRVNGSLDPVYANEVLTPVSHQYPSRIVDLTFTAQKVWGGDDCIYTPIEVLPLMGFSTANCSMWTSASDQVDLDTIPNFKTRWTTSEFPVRLDSPPGTPAPFFRFRVDLTVHVVYS